LELYFIEEIFTFFFLSVKPFFKKTCFFTPKRYKEMNGLNQKI